MSDDFNIEEMIRERNEMLIALDPVKYIAYMEKYNPGEFDYAKMPDSSILHSMHLARLQVTSFHEGIKAESRAWLNKRGLRTFEDGPPNAV